MVSTSISSHTGLSAHALKIEFQNTFVFEFQNTFGFTSSSSPDCVIVYSDLP